MIRSINKILMFWSIFTLIVFYFLFRNDIIDENLWTILLIFPASFLPSSLHYFIQRYISKRNVLKMLNKQKILGFYLREDIGQDNAGDCSNMKLRNNNLDIFIKYNSQDEKLVLLVDYWKNEYGIDLVKAELDIKNFNPFEAQGDYTYIKSNNGFLNFHGKYEIKKINNDRLNVRYWHIFPRELENHADANRGWEIWKKMDVK